MPYHLPFGWGQWDCNRIYKHAEAKPNPSESYLQPSGLHFPHSLCHLCWAFRPKGTQDHIRTQEWRGRSKAERSSHLFIIRNHFMHSHGTREPQLKAQDYCFSLLYPAHILQHAGTRSASDTHTGKQACSLLEEKPPCFFHWKLQNCH